MKIECVNVSMHGYVYCAMLLQLHCIPISHFNHFEYAQCILSTTFICFAIPCRMSSKSPTSSKNSLCTRPGSIDTALCLSTCTSQINKPWSLYVMMPFSVGVQFVKVRSMFLVMLVELQCRQCSRTLAI